MAGVDAKRAARAIAADGAVRGRVLGRLGQIGDSITEAASYARNAIIYGETSNETGHDYAPIRSLLAYSGLQPANAHSFYRNSGKGIPYGNNPGWALADAVSAGQPQTAIEVGDGIVPGEPESHRGAACRCNPLNNMALARAQCPSTNR